MVSRFALPARGFSLLVALVFSVAGLGSFFHQAFAEHEVCAEHGELVHAGHGEPSPDDGDHDDDHCKLCPASQEAGELALGSLVTASPASAPLVTAAWPRALPVPFDPLLLAPKNSPPAA